MDPVIGIQFCLLEDRSCGVPRVLVRPIPTLGVILDPYLSSWSSLAPAALGSPANFPLTLLSPYSIALQYDYKDALGDQHILKVLLKS